MTWWSSWPTSALGLSSLPAGILLDVSIFLVGFRCVHQTILVLSKWAVDFGQGERIDKEVASTEKPRISAHSHGSSANGNTSRPIPGTGKVPIGWWPEFGRTAGYRSEPLRRAQIEAVPSFTFGEVIIDDQDERM